MGINYPLGLYRLTARTEHLKITQEIIILYPKKSESPLREGSLILKSLKNMLELEELAELELGELDIVTQELGHILDVEFLGVAADDYHEGTSLDVLVVEVL